MIIILDAYPASSTSKAPSKKPSDSDRCRAWLAECEAAGHTILIPFIVYYEVLRELELRNATSQIRRLRSACLAPRRLVPLTLEHLELAARLWADVRRRGLPTAARADLDADVLLAAQVLSLGLSDADYVVATTNAAHLSRFVNAAHWRSIQP